jgi:hypothetical protein
MMPLNRVTPNLKEKLSMESETASQAAEAVETPQEKGAVLYNPKALSLVASLSAIFSWIVLVAYLAETIVQFLYVKAQLAQSQAPVDVATLIKEPGFVSYVVTNISTPLFTGLALFFVLQGVAIGLNILMEIDLKSGDAE